MDIKLNLENICLRGVDENYTQAIDYITKDGYQEYVPSFTYFGYRYIYVTGIKEEQATLDLLTMLVIHGDFKRLSHFECNNEDLNKIFNNSNNSLLSNLFYFPTDCPQREKNGWTGDANFSSNQIFMHLDAKDTLIEWFNNIRYAQNDLGQLPGIIPTTSWGYSWGNGPAWDMAISEVPYRIYQYTGDLQIVKNNFDWMVKYLSYLKTRINEDGLFEFGEYYFALQIKERSLEKGEKVAQKEKS